MVQAEIWRLLGNKGDRVPFNCIDGVNIALGDFLELADNMVVTAHAGNVDTPIVGICASEKVSGDGHLVVTGITNCIFKATILAGGSSTIGDLMSMGNAAGEINLATGTDIETGFCVGWAYTDGAAAHTTFVRSRF